MSLSQKHSVRSGSRVSRSVSLKSDHSKDCPPCFNRKTPSSESEKAGSHVSSSVYVKSDRSKDHPPNLSSASNKRFQHKLLHSNLQIDSKPETFKNNVLEIFEHLESEMIAFLKKELKRIKQILLKENAQSIVNEFIGNKCRVKEAALDLTLCFLREMKQDEVANVLEDELFFVQKLKCSLKKKHQCVCEGIAKQGNFTPLKSIYTDLYITQGGGEQINTEHEVRQIEVTSRHSESQEIQVKCTNLFEASERDKQIRTVLTKGVAGIGKSVSVQKFVLDWAEGKENSEISFIFPLLFREMNLKEKEKLSLMDLINQFFPETKGLNFTRRKQFKVLFILDGLDECRLPLNFKDNKTCHDVSSPVSLDVLLTNLITGNLLPSALVWITTRPAAASKIPPECIDRVTEVRGFNDGQKEEYFRKRFTDENQAKEIIDHVKQSKSLFIMCHIPVFCWISATVLHNILLEKNNQTDKASKILQKSNTEDTPETLTQMYTHFLRFQIQQSRRKYEGEYTPDVSWDKNTILSLGKLAFHQLERNNLIFYDTDLEDCGIDVSNASVYSGMCTQIFKEETGIITGTMYCFVHLSIQEFIAALYALLFLDIKKKSVFVDVSAKQKNKNVSLIDLLKTAVDKALESDTGHLDLFLRFLLGLSLQSSRRLLKGLLTQQDDNDERTMEIVQYIKQKLEADLSPERSINLFYCLNELNDQSLVKEIQTHFNKGSLSSADLSPAQWSALVFVLLTSDEEMEEFELQKFKKSDECLIRLSAVIKSSRRALLNDCNLTELSCPTLATVLQSETNLKELNLNNNNLLDSGVKLLCTGLTSKSCQLEILKLSNCSITGEGYKALSSALRSNSHLIELDLTGNDPGPSGVKELTELLEDKNGHLKKLRFVSPAAEEACQFVTGVVGKNPLLLTELNLSGRELGDTRVNQLSALLQDKHCRLETVNLYKCTTTVEACLLLISALKSNPSHLRDLVLSWNRIINTGLNHLCDLLKGSQCKLERLRIRGCALTDEGCSAVTSALKSNPSHLRELDLSSNKLGESAVKNLSDLLKIPQCKLEKINLYGCSITEHQCFMLSSALKLNPSHLRKLDLSVNKIQNRGVNELCDVLKDSHCKLERLRLGYCSLTDEGCLAVTSALKSNPSHLKELDLSGNQLAEPGVKHLSDLLMSPQCKLEKLNLYRCSIIEKLCLSLTSALKSNPSHLRELNLSWNQIKNTGVNHLCELLNDSHCKLEKLSLVCCDITDVSCLTRSLTNTTALQVLKKLDLRFNMIEDSETLIFMIRDSKCHLRIDNEGT